MADLAVLGYMDWELFNRQRVALLCAQQIIASIKDEAMADVLGVIDDALEGITNLGDVLIDAAVETGEISAERAKQAWADGCVAVGWPVPEEEE